jgi:plastocyanin
MLGSRPAFAWFATLALASVACSSSGSEAVPPTTIEAGALPDALAALGDAVSATLDGAVVEDVAQQAPAPEAAAEAAPPAAVTVTIPVNAMGMGPAAFGTNPLTVPVGTTVTWTNSDAIPHTATSDTAVWDSGVLGPGQSFSFTFANAGTFPYHCTIHGAASMSGTIVVQ